MIYIFRVVPGSFSFGKAEKKKNARKTTVFFNIWIQFRVASFRIHLFSTGEMASLVKIPNYTFVLLRTHHLHTLRSRQQAQLSYK